MFARSQLQLNTFLTLKSDDRLVEKLKVFEALKHFRRLILLTKITTLYIQFLSF